MNNFEELKSLVKQMFEILDSKDHQLDFFKLEKILRRMEEITFSENTTIKGE